MPCLFGALGPAPARWRPLVDRFSAIFDRLELREHPGGWLGGHAHAPGVATGTDAAGRPFAVHGERQIYRGVPQQLITPALYEMAEDGSVRLSADARGTVALFDRERHQTVVTAGWASCFPLYYAAGTFGFVFSSHLKALAIATDASLDPAGVTEYLVQNWCLNGRTLFKGIRRLLPGQSLAYDLREQKLRLTETSRLWTDSAADTPPSFEEIWGLLCAACRAPATMPEASAVMLSGGWDSRLLLGALLSTLGSDHVLSASHGQLDSFELGIARKLAAVAGIPHLEVPLEADCLGSPDDLDRLFDRSESLLYPYWRLAGARLTARGTAMLASGVLGEVLGGHYTIFGSRSKRLQHFVARKIFNTSEKPVSQTPSDALRATIREGLGRRHFWYLKQEFSESTRREVADALEEDVEGVVTQYLRRGISSADAMIEAYVTEHRGLVMIAGQPLVAQSEIDITLPFADRNLLRAVCSIPIHERIHNTLSRAILQRHHPALLSLPLAATVVPARMPIIAQEAGRLARRGLDVLAERLYFATKGRLSRARPFGWMNLEEVLRSATALDDLTDNLRWDMFDRASIARQLDAIREYKARINLAQTFLKMAYLDRMVM